MTRQLYKVSPIDPDSLLFEIQEVEATDDIPEPVRALKKRLDLALENFGKCKQPRDKSISTALYTIATKLNNAEEIRTAEEHLQRVESAITEQFQANGSKMTGINTKDSPFARGAIDVSINPANERDLLIQPKDEKIELPADQSAFISEVLNALTVLKSIFPEAGAGDGRATFFRWAHSIVGRTEVSLDRRYKEYLHKLVGLAQVGVSMERAQVAVARSALDAFKREIVLLEGNEVKALYMWRLGGWCLLTFGLTLLTFLFLDANAEKVKTLPLLRPFGDLRDLLLVMSGSSVGLFLSFASRRYIENFEDLASVARDRSDPRLRLIFVLATTSVASLILLTGMISIEIGGFSSNDLFEKGTTAFLIGAFFGLAEKALPTTIRRRAADFVGAMAPKS